MFRSAYNYAVPLQLFHNGIFYKVVYRLLVNMDKVAAQYNSGRYNHELVFRSHDVIIDGVYLVVNSSVSAGSHRLFDWNPDLEAYPMYYVDFLYTHIREAYPDADPEEIDRHVNDSKIPLFPFDPQRPAETYDTQPCGWQR